MVVTEFWNEHQTDVAVCRAEPAVYAYNNNVI